MNTIKLIFLLIPLLLFSCEKTNPPVVSATNQLLSKNKLKITIKTGLSGTLTKREGDCEPISSNAPHEKTCFEYPVSRTIYIYEFTTMKNVGGYLPFFDSVNTNFVGQSIADADGFYQFTLSPGKYSVFVMENNKFYANSFDGTDGVNPIVIKTDSVSVLNMQLDYAVE